MANYKFDNHQIEIKNPALEIVGVIDNYNGTGSVEIVLSLGSANNKTLRFWTLLDGFTYSGDWTQAEVETWVNNKLTEYEV